MKEKVSAENRVREIRRKTRKRYSSEENVSVVHQVKRMRASGMIHECDGEIVS